MEFVWVLTLHEIRSVEVGWHFRRGGWWEELPALPQPLPLHRLAWTWEEARPGCKEAGERGDSFQWGVSYCSVVFYLKWRRGCRWGKSRIVDVKNQGQHCVSSLLLYYFSLSTLPRPLSGTVYPVLFGFLFFISFFLCFCLPFHYIYGSFSHCHSFINSSFIQEVYMFCVYSPGNGIAEITRTEDTVVVLLASMVYEVIYTCVNCSEDKKTGRLWRGLR